MSNKTTVDKYIGEIGVIEYVHVGYEDHGIYTFSIGLKFGGTHQAFGGYALDAWSEKHQRRVGTPAGLDLIMQLTTLLDVQDLHKAVGKYVYALRTSSAWNAEIVGLRRLEPDGGKQLTIDDWKAQWRETLDAGPQPAT